MILVTAAHGNQGRLLIPRLISSHAAVRAWVRSEASAQALRRAGVEEVVVGDMTDQDTMARAFNGVEKVYHIGPSLHPKEKEIGIAAIDVARGAGVKHFVYSSVLHAITTDFVQHEVKRDVEEYLLSSGLEFTILQPANYMLPLRLKSAFEQSVFRLYWSLDRRQSMVDLADVTEVAAMVLDDTDRHAGATYELVAPGRHTAYDIAEIISSVVGRDISTELIDPEMYIAQFLGINPDPYQVRGARAISARLSTHDFIGNPNVLTWLLGRQPTTFAQFTRKHFKIS
jgi:uncharacterized protein YbjT (DUF2867 family)